MLRHSLFTLIKSLCNKIQKQHKNTLDVILNVILGSLFLFITYLSFSLIQSTNHPLEWTGAIGGMLGGIGSLIALFFAWWAISQNNKIHKEKLSREDKINDINFVTSLIEHIEKEINKIHYKDESGRDYSGNDSLKYFANQTTNPCYYDLSFNFANIEPLMCIFNQYLDIISILTHTKHYSEVLKKYQSTSINQNLITLLFIIALRSKNDSIYKFILHHHYYDDFILTQHCNKIINNVLDALKKNKRVYNFTLVDLDIITSLNNDISFNCNVLQLRDKAEIQLFNNYAEQIGLKFRLDSMIPKFLQPN